MRDEVRRRLPPAAFSFVLGALTVLGFAPFSLFILPVLTLAMQALLWRRAARWQDAALTGFAFGLGLFLFGVSWVYVSLHDFGAMPAPLAALATLLFCAFLALFPALVGALYAGAPFHSGIKLALVLPVAWTALEWTRGWLFTGFPWLAFGYSQVPASALAGYAPLLGIYGVSLATAASAGLIASGWLRLRNAYGGQTAVENEMPRGPFLFRAIPPLLVIVALWFAGWALKQIEWTQPTGEAVSVSLLQGNVPQDLKFRPERIEATLNDYRVLAESSASRLIIFPETALPLFLDNVPRFYLEALAAHARKNNGDVLIGVPERLPSGQYYNSVISLGTARAQSYRKSHLVPFGEFIPLRPVLGSIVGALAIPLQDFSRGTAHPRPLAVAGQRVAVNICYEDAFGEEIIRQLPEATLLVNVSNVAWFGRSIAPRQHQQISQARALETGRYMLRATNTGVTAVIDARGEIVTRAPEFTRAVVTHRVPGFEGATPYVRWGNGAVLALCLMLAVVAFVAGMHARR